MGQPVCLTFSADMRCSTTDYCNDQTWELRLGQGEPAALALQTTFGLRARSMRLFPRFSRQNAVISSPDAFFTAPVVLHTQPGYARLRFEPFSGVECQYEVCIADSQTISGQIRLRNDNPQPESLRVEWAALLNPMDSGESMAVITDNMTHILHGSTSGLHPVCFATGGPEPASSPFPALVFRAELEPGQSFQFQWALAALSDAASSLEAARQVAVRNWDAETARMEMIHTAQKTEILTGNPEWDAVLNAAENQAWRLLFPGSSQLPGTSFVGARQPEQGYSMRGTGNDYPPLWNGQTVWDAQTLASLILPGGASCMVEIVENFLSTQNESGQIDFKPGLAGQRSKILAQPGLVHLAWQVSRTLEDSTAWLCSIYPALLKFIHTWFSPEHDRDQDGFPELDSSLQTGVEDLPFFNPWHPQASGLMDVTALESPALGALLVTDIEDLLQIARQLEETQDCAWLKEKAAQLRAHVEACWDETSASYHYRDRDGHYTLPGETLAVLTEDGKLAVRTSLKPPRRLLICVDIPEENTRTVRITLQGRYEGKWFVETFEPRSITWVGKRGFLCSQRLFQRIESVTTAGLPEGAQITISTPDYSSEDISLFLPLWAGIPSRQRAAELVEKTWQARYLENAGGAFSPVDNRSELSGMENNVSPAWNLRIGEGLLHYGYRQESADLLIRMLNSAVQSLKNQNCFFNAYQAASSQGLGERNVLAGLFPRELFLKTLGLLHLSPKRIIVQAKSPFPVTIVVKYHRMILTFKRDEVLAVLPNGRQVKIKGAGAHLITLP